MEKKCKNIECKNLILENRTYCSLTCRNVYVNKHLRDYSKISESNSLDKKYYNNPKKCIKCDVIISYENRRNKYCSHSCAASETNKGRVVSEFTKNKHKKSLQKYYKINNIQHGIVNCKNCDIKISKQIRKKYCSDFCKKEYRRKNMTEFQKYKQDCLFKFNLSVYHDEFDFALIKTHGWYSPANKKNNLNGVSRDHMFSIRDGFDNKIDSKIISHPANCKLILQKDNSSKYKKSSIILEDLLKRIKKWNKKYKK